MLTYEYTARNTKTGQRVKASVQAENEQAAAKLVAKEGLVPTDIHISGQAGITAFLNSATHRVTIKDKVLFSRQLATLINAGLPIVQSLRSVADQTSNKSLKLIINQIVSDVEGGSTLAASLANYPKVFNPVYINLVAAGEASGTLDKTFERLAVQEEKDAELISKIRGAMIYPLIVVFVMIAVVTFMLVKVLPQVQVFYKGLPGAHLPLITQLLLDASHFVIHFWWLVVSVVVALVLISFRLVRTTATGRSIADNLKMHMPPTAPLFMKMYMARFASTASTLVASGVPLLQVLDITSRAVNNVHIAAAIKRAADKVKGGKALSDSLQKEPAFLELVPNMIRIGEQSGSLEQMLGKVADYYEKEVDEQVKAISTIIEPILMVILGIVALIIVAAVLLPIYGLANQGLGSGTGPTSGNI